MKSARVTFDLFRQDGNHLAGAAWLKEPLTVGETVVAYDPSQFGGLVYLAEVKEVREDGSALIRLDWKTEAEARAKAEEAGVPQRDWSKPTTSKVCAADGCS